MSLRFGSALLGILVALTGCTHRRSDAHTASLGRVQELTLDGLVRGSAAGWDSRDGPGGDLWRFVAPALGSYKFEIFRSQQPPFHQAGIELVKLVDGNWKRVGQTDGVLRVPLEAGTYYVNVGGNRGMRGAYALRVTRDDSEFAAIRREDPNIVEPLCERATLLGEEPTLGTFGAQSGGAQATCGGVGGEVVHVLEVRGRSLLTLHALAQFQPVLEVRSGCMQTKTPVRCSKGHGHQAVLLTTLDPGRYHVVLDSAEVGSLDTGLPGAAIRGAYSLSARLEPVGAQR